MLKHMNHENVSVKIKLIVFLVIFYDFKYELVLITNYFVFKLQITLLVHIISYRIAFQDLIYVHNNDSTDDPIIYKKYCI